MDKLTLIPNDQPTSNSSTQLTVDVGQSSVYQVRVKTVSQVDEFNFPQARKAWEALVDAGMDPGELVANGLSLGHGLQITEKVMIAPIKSNNTEDLLGETQVNDQFLVGYKYSSELIDNPTTKLISGMSQNGLSLVENSLTVGSSPQTIQTVNLTAIVKNQTPQLNSSTDNQKKIE